MMNLKNETEQRILASARKVFTLKGYEGATMEDIARDANVNKAALHYYFRSKSKLFELIFNEVLTLVNDKLASILNADIDFENKVRQIVPGYIDILMEHPFSPDFVIHELSSNPGRIEKIVKRHRQFFRSLLKFQIEIQKELRARNISNITPFELTLNIVSLCVFPFLGKPIITRISKSFGELEFRNLMDKRKTDIADLVLKSLHN